MLGAFEIVDEIGAGPPCMSCAAPMPGQSARALAATAHSTQTSRAPWLPQPNQRCFFPPKIPASALVQYSYVHFILLILPLLLHMP